MAEPDFEECWLDFLSRSDQNRIATEFLKRNLHSLGLRGAERILSIGPGNGEVDVALMSVLPELKVYSAAEPDESLRETLKQRVENMGRNIQIDLKPDTIETYSGPSEPVDVILMVHVCYYFRDSFPVQIKRALQWPRPGGHLVLVHKEISPFRSEIENLMNRDHESISISWSIAEKLKTMNIPYKEEHTTITLDWTPPGLASIVRVFTNLYPNPIQLQQCEDIAKRYSKEGVTKVHESQLIQVIPQTALDHFK